MHAASTSGMQQIQRGLGLGLIGGAIALPLLGLSDKPTAYHPTEHLQSLARHLGFGAATAATTHVLEGSR